MLFPTFVLPDSYKFDFDGELTQLGYQSVAYNTLKSSGAYGWNGTVEVRDGGIPGEPLADLYVDCHYGTWSIPGIPEESTFSVDVAVPGGLYEVTLYFWEEDTTQFDVFIEGN